MSRIFLRKGSCKVRIYMQATTISVLLLAYSPSIMTHSGWGPNSLPGLHIA